MIFDKFNFMIRKHIDSKHHLFVNLPTTITIKQQILNSMLIKMICFCFDNFFFYSSAISAGKTRNANFS